jgi:hypothetical protein
MESNQLIQKMSELNKEAAELKKAETPETKPVEGAQDETK